MCASVQPEVNHFFQVDLLNQIMVAIKGIANASPCDDVFFDDVFHLSTDVNLALTGKESDSRSVALDSALLKISQDMLEIITATSTRTRKANLVLARICNLLQRDSRSTTITDLAAKLLRYVPVLQLLLPNGINASVDHTLTDRGMLPDLARSIINEINRTAASSEKHY